MLVCDCLREVRSGRSTYPDFTKQLEFQRSSGMRINQVYSSLCSLGSNLEAQMQRSDSSIHVCGRNFFRDSQMSNDRYLGRFAPLSAIESSQTLSSLHLPGLIGSSTTISAMHDDTSQILRPDIRLPVPQAEAARQCHKKRKIEIITDEKDQMGYRTEWEQSNRKKAICNTDLPPCQSYQEDTSDTREKRGQIKRSQKIGDRITALQKLVSPFGKTNTASVLNEATIYIRYLQEQIQMLSIPYFGMRTLHHQGAADGSNSRALRSRGLCLVPVSFTQKLANKDAAMSQFI